MQIQEEQEDLELLPARAETRLPPGKVTATKSVPSCAGTDTFKGLNGRQHQLSSRGERQGSPPRRLLRAEGDLLARMRLTDFEEKTALVMLWSVNPQAHHSTRCTGGISVLGAFAN